MTRAASVSPLGRGGIGPDGVEVQGRCTKGSPGTWEVRSSPSKKSRNEPAASSGSEIVAALNQTARCRSIAGSRDVAERGHRVIENPRPEPHAAAWLGSEIAAAPTAPPNEGNEVRRDGRPDGSAPP